ncbi:MAG: DUF3105 domain-containing protein [Pseudonocardiaceae bacterium]
MRWGLALCAVLLLGCAPEPRAPEPRAVDPVASFTPSAADPDPSRRIEGIAIDPPATSVHVGPGEQVQYTQRPPSGGSHDAVWADCDGTVYGTAVRDEHMVHSLEHGAVWITYDAARVTGEALQSLVDRVRGRGYTMLSPYPDLDAPISLQSWGHQLTVDSADDPRIDRFLRALRLNQYTFPEPGATCTTPPGTFDVANPPPFDS